MQLHRSAVDLVVQAPAKLNLFFEVLAKRSDGFHEVETLMCPINLCDTLYFRDSPDAAVELRCRKAHGSGGRGLDDLPEGPENLVARAVDLTRRRAGVRRGAKLLLIKRIPAAAGLGGGSSDAAAALMAANEGWKLGLSHDELMGLAAELGSDVPFFLAGGPAICRGRGEIVEPLARLGSLDFVVVRPPEGLATAAVYGRCRPAERPRSVRPLLEALDRGDRSLTGSRLWNRLQPAAETLSPWIRRMREEFATLGCLGHGMSGSGTSYFGICRHARHARRTERGLRARGFEAVFTVRSCR
jgi:4-diphosphocytidyl-2-C-methyl-D-erythritol kinase